MPDEQFRFTCSPGVACFNECCRDLNQFLYPYDILRLKKGLGMSSGEFLERYTIQQIGPESGLPIVALKTTHAEGSKCPFVTEKGCRVYPHRPSSCRIYPLVRTISRNRESGKITEGFMLLNEPHCLGFNEPREQTVRQWIKEQGVGTDNLINDKLMEIISLKNQLHPGRLNLNSRRRFYMALYDVDDFRNHIFKNDLLEDVEVHPEKLTAAETDDTALLEVGMEWVKQVLFNK
jgi:Fe-S-cluster containining protein